MTSICQGDSPIVINGQSFSESGNYLVDGMTNAFGCDSSVLLSLSVFEQFDVSLEEVICQGESYVFGSNTYSEAGTYPELFTSVNGCDSMVTLNLAIAGEASLGAAYAGEDEFECSDQAMLIADLPIGASGLWTNENSDNVVIVFPESNATGVSGLVQGENVFIWSLSYEDCIDYSQDTLVITVDTLRPQAKDDDFVFVSGFTETEINLIGNDQNLIADNWEIILPPSIPHGSLEEIQTGRYSLIPNAGFEGISTFDYELCNKACPDLCSTATVSILIRDSDEGGIHIIITPNGDDKNERLYFPGVETDPVNEIAIINRWGSVVYSQKNYKNDWYGKSNNGKILPEGTYYFILKLQIPEGDIEYGSVTIKR